MKPLEKTELYQNVSGFLKAKGIELKDGSYARAIEKSCHLLADAINLGQKGAVRAKQGVESKLEQMRQVIHEKTAPKPPVIVPEPPPKAKSAKASAKSSPARKKTKQQKPKRRP